MMTAEHTKRRWMPWWLLPDPSVALCPKCRKPMRAASTRDPKNGLIIQHRKCETCGETGMNSYPDGESQSQ